MTGDRFELLRRMEAMLFASAEPLSEGDLASRLPDGADLAGLIEELAGHYAGRGVNLVRRGRGWAFRTAPDVAPYLSLERHIPRKLSRAAIETMAIIAYQQPVTRAEIEEIRGVGLSRGTLDILLEAGWIKPKGRRRVAGRPVTWGTTEAFLDHFGLESLDALPGIDELKAAGLLERSGGLSEIAMRDAEVTEDEVDPAGGEYGKPSEFSEVTLEPAEAPPTRPKAANDGTG
ncbi:MAG: SMC-Scp complex subunit ScpB [Rhodospirillales bacterium]|nr:MAG: SMC-Scp complex subunit ScpB [Rhodospirillales bacterium]